MVVQVNLEQGMLKPVLRQALSIVLPQGLRDDDVMPLADDLPTGRDEMYVGHLPFMERVIAYLITGDAHRRVVAFRNGGVVRLAWDAEALRWVIGWTLFPSL